MLKPGDTFLLKTPPDYKVEHLYVAISEPKDDKIILVNVTKKRGLSDLSCELNKGDHPFIKEPSVINYADALDSDVNLLEDFFENGYGRSSEPMQPDVLEKIIAGVSKTDAFPPKFNKYFK